MDGYPYPYVAHARPGILLSGLNSRLLERDRNSLLSNGLRIASELPPLDNSRSHALEAAFLKFDPGDEFNDTSDSPTPLTSSIFRFKSCGREYTLPCRKASPAASEVGSPVDHSGSSPLRSPFSPLSHSSPLHPDGVMTPSWPLKYHDAIPSILVSAFLISYDQENDVLNDNRLKNEINNIRNSLADSNYGITLAVVLLADESMEQCLSTDERLTNIRKGTKLENKSTFFYLPSSFEDADLKPFAQSVLSSIRPICMEFYKNHYKMSRRKKDKSGESSPSDPTMEGVSQNLPKTGWMIRSEYKMALFSEFRFEMDAAARHYKEVVDLMMGSGGLFDLYPFWSPRWNELRLLADTSALRRIRCLLANGQTSAAARFWRVYHNRTKHLLQRKGKGTSTYGWRAWEARFSRCMAETIQSMFCLVTDTSARKVLEGISRKQTTAYAMPEKSLQSELLAPSDYLHHPGFWFNQAAKYSEARRLAAKLISKEDLIPPAQSPAARVARRSEVFDTFLCPDPHIEGTSYDHVDEVTNLLEKALFEFSERHQSWMSDRLRLSLSLHAKNESDLKTIILQEAWKSNRWRGPTWTAIIKDLATDMHLLAKKSEDFTTQIKTTWELLNSHLAKSEGVNYDIDGLLDQAIISQEAQNSTSYDINIVHEENFSFLNVNFCFEKDSENLGEAIRAQLSLHSNAHNDSSPLTFSYLLVTFHGNAPGLKITHSQSDSTEKSGGCILEVKLEATTKGGSFVSGEADLTIYPQQTKVFTFDLSMREPGKVSAAKAVVGFEKQPVHLQYSKNLDVGPEIRRWYLWRKGNLSSQRLLSRNSHQGINVLPKLPKLKIHLPALVEKYFVGERIILDLKLVNEETYEITGSVDIRLAQNTQNDGAFVKVMQAHEAEENITDGATDTDTCGFGNLAPTAVETKRILLQMPNTPVEDLKIEFEARYSQTGGDDDSVSKTTSANLVVAEPLRTAFTVSPDWHPKPWPSFFDLEVKLAGNEEQSKQDDTSGTWGLSSRWNFHTTIASVADVDLTIEKVELDLHTISDGAVAAVKPVDQEAITLKPADETGVDILIDIVKEEMEDIGPTIMSPALRLHWRRTDSDNSRLFEKFIPAPRMNLPSNEPRVIATLGKSSDESIEVLLHLENPSLHYLSFEIGVEPSDDFAFSGPKLEDVHLVPFSRHTCPFVVVPFVRGTWMQVEFRVVDVYFNKSLRINAGLGVRRVPSTGALLVWVGS